MTISSIGSSNSYLSVIGDSRLAQTNRIYRLVTGSLPYNVDYTNIIDGAISFTPGADPATITIQQLFTQSQNIQTAVGAMDSAYKGLEQVQTRIEILSDIATTIAEYPDLTNSQLNNINNQLNYILQEIDDISKSQSYDNTPVLNGMIQSEGYYVDVIGNNGVDITDAFNSVSSESLGLPRVGEAHVTQATLGDFYNSLVSADSQVEAQKGRIESYQSELSASFEELRSTILAASSSLGNSNLVSLLNTPSASSSVNNNLLLTMSSISNNILIDNSDYERLAKIIYS